MTSERMAVEMGSGKNLWIQGVAYVWVGAREETDFEGTAAADEL